MQQMRLYEIPKTKNFGHHERRSEKYCKKNSGNSPPKMGISPRKKRVSGTVFALFVHKGGGGEMSRIWQIRKKCVSCTHKT